MSLYSTAFGMMVLNAVVVLCCLLLAILEGQRVRKVGLVASVKLQKQSPWLRVGIPLSLPLICVLVFLNSGFAPSFHRPFWLALNGRAIMWNAFLGTVAFFFGLLGILAIRTRHPERWKIWIGGLVLLAVMFWGEWISDRPVAGDLYARLDRDGAILQSSGSSCTAASAANLVKLFGISKTEREMAELFGTTVSGTSDEQATYGLAKLGLTTEPINVPDRDLSKLTGPAIIGVYLAGIHVSHAVAFIGWKEGKAIVIDPMSGTQRLTPQELRDWWHGGALLVHSPQH